MKAMRSIVLILAALMMTGCAFIAAWNELSPDEQARILLSATQDEVYDLTIRAKAMRSEDNPEYEEVYQTQIKPSLEKANDGIRELALAGQDGEVTIEEINAKIRPIIIEIIEMIEEWEEKEDEQPDSSPMVTDC